MREVLRILPLLGVQVFEKPKPVAQPGKYETISTISKADPRDTIIVPAQEDGFQEVFLGENAWYAIRISGGMLPNIKYIAAYRTHPISAITHYAAVEKIEPYGDDGKYRLVFAGPAKEIPPVPFGDAAKGSMQGPRYTSLESLLKAKTISEIPTKVSLKT